MNRQQSKGKRHAAPKAQQESALNQLLIDACYARKLPLIKQALRNGADPRHFEIEAVSGDPAEDLIWTPITAAMIGEYEQGSSQQSRRKTIAVIETMMRAGADLDVGVTSILNLVGDIGGESDILPMLLKAGLVVNEEHAYEAALSPLAAGNVQALVTLAQQGIDLNAYNRNGYTALHSCVMGGELGDELQFEAGSLPKMQYLIDFLEQAKAAGVDLNMPTHDRMTTLQLAMFSENMDLAAALVHCGAEVNVPIETAFEAKNQMYYSPLALAARAGEPELMTLMLSHGANYESLVYVPSRLVGARAQVMVRTLRHAALSHKTLQRNQH